MADYRDRTYLSAGEAAKMLGVSVAVLHDLVRAGRIPAKRAASGQFRFDISDLREYSGTQVESGLDSHSIGRDLVIEVSGTCQRILNADARSMSEIADGSTHLAITSPPYFNAKMYSAKPIEGDLGDVHELETWLTEIGRVWAEVFRVLQPGRKFFLNIMNLPIRENGSFRALNLVGRTVELCGNLGWVFKRDIVWQKTNSVRAHFGTYPYPGGILINNNHEFILEFEKPAPKGYQKYRHLTKEQKEASRLDKAFWIEIKKSDVWVMKPQGSGDRRSHVAPFPYELPYRLIKAYSYVGETVLDPFVGSGTTLLAAADLRRNGVGYEINPEIAEGAIKALKNHQPELWK